MQIKTAVKLPPHTWQNGHSQKSTNCKWWRGYGEKGTLLDCWWECKLVLLLWITVWRLLKKTKNKPTIWSAIPLLWIYLKKTIFRKDAYTLSFLNTILFFFLLIFWKNLCFRILQRSLEFCFWYFFMLHKLFKLQDFLLSVILCFSIHMISYICQWTGKR